MSATADHNRIDAATLYAGQRVIIGGREYTVSPADDTGEIVEGGDLGSTQFVNVRDSAGRLQQFPLNSAREQSARPTPRVRVFVVRNRPRSRYKA